MSTIGQVIDAMIQYYAGDARRINHFLKVYGFAKAIGEMEGLGGASQETIEVAALTHDIGIKNSESKYHCADGNHQQDEGPPEARKLLSALRFDAALTDRVCWLIAHHHTYDNVVGIDYQILIEADFLVNAYEDDFSADAIKSVREKIFRTKTGTAFLNGIYGLKD